MPAFSSPSVLRALHRQSLLLGALTLLLFIVGDIHQSAIGFDSRFVMFAKEMLRHGPSFFPTTYGEPYADYNATATLFTWLLSLPFGEVNSLTAWLPTAIASSVIVTLIYRLVAPQSTTWALLSVALLLLSMTFITETRAVSLDQMLAAVSLSAFYLAYAHDHFEAPRRHFWLLLLLVLGFAIRGPIGLVIPTGMLCSYFLLSGQWRRMISVGLQALVILLLCIGLLLFLAWVSGGQAFVQDVIRMQVTGRIDGSEGASGPFYYFTSSMGNYALAYPLAVLVLVVVLIAGRKPSSPALHLVKYCAAAGLIVMIGLSVPQAKKARYLLPMLPMAAIIAAYPFQGVRGRVFAALRVFIQAILLMLPALLIAGLMVASKRFADQLPPLNAIYIILGVLQVIALGLLFKAHLRALDLAACAVLAMWSSYILVLEPAEQNAYNTRDFTLNALHLIDQAPAPLVLHGMGKDAKAIKFMVNVDRDLLPVFTQSAVELTALQAPVWIVMDRKDYQALQGTELGNIVPALTGQFDKNDFVLLHLP